MKRDRKAYRREWVRQGRSQIGPDGSFVWRDPMWTPGADPEASLQQAAGTTLGSAMWDAATRLADACWRAAQEGSTTIAPFDVRAVRAMNRFEAAARFVLSRRVRGIRLSRGEPGTIEADLELDHSQGESVLLDLQEQADGYFST